MAYDGWLVQVGNYIIPADKYIKANSYSAYVNMQDLEPWTDANGYLHREAVELKVAKVEFETPAMLTNIELTELMKNIQANYIVPKARQFLLTAYIPEYDNYVTQMAYLADFQPTIYSNANGVIKYNSIKFSLIGGVYNG